MKLLSLFILMLFPLVSKAQHFVLVGGTNNEQIPTYFSSFESLLRSKNIKHISRIMPSSFKTVSENTEFLRRRLLDLYQTYQEPLIIFSHSKGGLEVANTLGLYYRDFPAKVVRASVYANVPFQGSPYMAVSLEEFQAQWGRFGNQYNPVYLNAVRVLKSLSTEIILEDLENSHRGLTPAEKNELSSRSFYLRTQQAREKVSPFLKKSADYLRDYGPNDGLIPTENQKRKSFGHDLGIFKDIDHTDLFVQHWTSESQAARALTKVTELLP